MKEINNKSSESTAIVLFDGNCVLCNSLFKFILKFDKRMRFKFGILQDLKIINLLQANNISDEGFDTVILIYGNRIYTESGAVLRICNILGGWFRFFFPLILVPKFLRNYAYKLIARNRFKFFGKRDSCLIPDLSVKSRFIVALELQNIVDNMTFQNNKN